MPPSSAACLLEFGPRLAPPAPAAGAGQVYRLKHDPDRSLVLACQRERAAAGGPNGDSFGKLWERYQTRVFSLCYDLTGDRHDALDTSQETFARAFRRLDTFLFQARFAHWLYRIATNACIDLRRSARTRHHLSIDRMPVRSDPTTSSISLRDHQAEQPFEPLARGEMSADIHRAIDGLSVKLKEIVMLRYFEDLSYDDIRERLGVSMGTVKSRLFRAHERLQYWLEPAIGRHMA